MGRKAECKDCHNARSGAAYQQSLRARASALVSRARIRAERKGLAFDLNSDSILSALQTGRCQVTGQPFDFAVRGERNLYGPSLDRVDPKDGYTKENTRVVLFGYNACKSTATPDEVALFFKTVAGALQ